LSPASRRDQRHVETVKQYCKKTTVDKALRGIRTQLPAREKERDVKKRAVTLNRLVKGNNGNANHTSDLLLLEPVTLRRWEREWREDRLFISPRGRPPERADIEVREAILDILFVLGPATGVPALEALFPTTPRRELESILARFRNQYEDDGKLATELIWSRAGAVWAMDYTKPPSAVDGIYKDILVVRDLASGMEVESLPVPVETGFATAAALEDLFIRHGAPIAIKRDNGGTLKSFEVAQLLKRYGVEVLPSPVRKPQYNGSCEAGNGAIKTRAHHVASRNGRPGHWTCDDVEEARRLSNSTARPLGPKGPSPLQSWACRKRVTTGDRRRFRRRVQLNAKEIRRKEEERMLSGELDDKVNEGVTPLKEDTVTRRAVRMALESCGYLSYRRRNSSSN
jgi:transposase InsO family protein